MRIELLQEVRRQHMKIIHCADLHLDSKMESNLNKDQAKERKKELLLTFERMIRYATENGVQVIIIAGDLFDTTHITKSASSKVKEQIETHAQIDFLYLKGNHDRDNFLTEFEELPPNLKVFGEQWTKFTYGNVTITGAELTDVNRAGIYDSLVLEKNDVNIVVLHGQESQYAAKDKSEVIPIRTLQNKYIDYLALGHIHEYKYEKLDNRGHYCYPGCLEGRGFDECGEKGFVLLDIEEDKVKPTFVKHAARTCQEVYVDITGRNTTGEIVTCIDGKVSTMQPESLVKIVLVGTTEIDTDKDITYLVKKYSNQFYFVKIYDHTRLAVNYEDYRMDQSLKGEFIRLLEKVDIPAEEKDQIILTGIRALAGEEIDI